VDLVEVTLEFFGVVFQSLDHCDVFKSGCIEAASDFFCVGDSIVLVVGPEEVSGFGLLLKFWTSSMYRSALALNP
jgi:hypothetical protein